jgi:hypothetical protein
MAERARIENGVGMLPVPEIQDPKKENLPFVVGYVAGVLGAIVRVLNGRLTFGNGNQSSQSGNIDGQWITYVFSSVANEQAEIPHGLGRTPVGYFVAENDRACTLYSSNRSGWGKKSFFLKCNVASAVVKFLLF